MQLCPVSLVIFYFQHSLKSLSTKSVVIEYRTFLSLRKFCVRRFSYRWKIFLCLPYNGPRLIYWVLKSCTLQNYCQQLETSPLPAKPREVLFAEQSTLTQNKGICAGELVNDYKANTLETRNQNGKTHHRCVLFHFLSLVSMFFLCFFFTLFNACLQFQRKATNDFDIEYCIPYGTFW